MMTAIGIEAVMVMMMVGKNETPNHIHSMSRKPFGYPDRSEGFSDLTLISSVDAIEFKVHKIMLLRYPYFKDIMYTLKDTQTIFIPFTSRCIEYTDSNKYVHNHPTLYDKQIALELCRCMDYVGLYHDELFYELFKSAEFSHAVELINAYGTPEYIKFHDKKLAIPTFISCELDTVKYMVCISDEKFSDIFDYIKKLGYDDYGRDLYCYIAVRACCNINPEYIEYLEKLSLVGPLRVPDLPVFKNVKKYEMGCIAADRITKYVGKLLST